MATETSCAAAHLWKTGSKRKPEGLSSRKPPYGGLSSAIRYSETFGDASFKVPVHTMDTIAIWPEQREHGPETAAYPISTQKQWKY